jgi:ribonuclease Z
MEPFNVHILGCGSALPTLRHYSSSQIVELRGKFFMIDCGEGTQIQLRRSHQNFQKIVAVFISHLHGDHCLGLSGMISTFGMLGRIAPLHVYAPMEFKAMFEAQMQFYCSNMTFDVVFHGHDTTQRQTIYSDKSLWVETLPLEHRVPCAGFIFHEKPTLPHIRRDMIDFYNIPISQINNIKNGADWQLEDGTVVKNDRLVTPAAPVRSYAYCSDTRYMPKLWQALKGVNLLYHEATYADDYKDRAKLYFHSTAREAATVALKAEAKSLLLGHFSARYNDENLLLREAQEVFPNVALADENRSFPVV